MWYEWLIPLWNKIGSRVVRETNRQTNQTQERADEIRSKIEDDTADTDDLRQRMRRDASDRGAE